jgi:hypothetical protein
MAFVFLVVASQLLTFANVVPRTLTPRQPDLAWASA